MLLAEAWATLIKPHVAAMQGVAILQSAPAAVVPRLADLLPPFNLADCPERVTLDLAFSLRCGIRSLGGALRGPGFRQLRKGLD